jgi:inner membrane protein involved in colicin E2 resistance
MARGNLMATLQLQLSDEAIVYVEVRPSANERLREVSTEKLEANFDKVSRSLRGVVQSINAQLDQIPIRPDKITVEMGAELKGEADLWLVSGEAKGHIKISMTWEKPTRK